MSAEDSGLVLKPRVLPCHRSGPGHFLPRAAPGSRRPLAPHTTGVCSVCTRSRKGEEEGWSSSACVPTAAHTGEEGARPHSLNGSLQCLPGLARSEEFASPTSPPKAVWLSVRSSRESQGQKEETLSRGPVRLLRQTWGDRPPFAPLFPLQNSS